LTILVPILLAVVPTVASALIGLVTYHNQKRTDRRVELKNRRMKEYERYLRAYSGTLGWEGAEDSDDAKKATSEYWRVYRPQRRAASR
jgi:hypothetical protein